MLLAGVMGEWNPFSLLSCSGWREALSIGIGNEMPLKREETDSFKLGLTEVVDVPGDRPRVVVERN